MRHTVQDFLGRSRAAHATHQLDLGGGRSVTIWENHDDRVSYDDTSGHTFSLYLQGGTGTRRVDGGGASGWPGAVCVMPEGHRSEWHITRPFRFVHLHMPDAALRASFARMHDCDARQLDLHEVSCADRPALAGPLRQLALAAQDGDILLADSAASDLVAHLERGRVTLRRGLAPHVLRRVDEWIAAEMENTIRLADLAALASMSEYHFHRMFRLSRGIAPHGWITARRIDRARDMLRGPVPVARIAAACGFSSQSHLTRVFRRQTGRTPAQYRDLLGEGRGPRHVPFPSE